MTRALLLLIATVAVGVGLLAASGGATVSPSGLVAAYGFDEGTGTTLGDASVQGNDGVVSGAAWTVGRFGKALEFDGVDDWVTVADSASLDLLDAMTIEAWVLPTALGTDWRTIAIKEQPGDLAYALYASGRTTGVPSGHVNVARDEETAGTTPLAVGEWTHLAATYDGSQLHVYVNGVLDASRSLTGPISVSGGALRIGGNSVWGEFLEGRVDELRIYSRALSGSEIRAQMEWTFEEDATAPTVASTTPGATVHHAVKVQFGEAMDPSTIDSASVFLTAAGGASVPATVSYDAVSGAATLQPTAPLAYATFHTVTVTTAAQDLAGNALASAYSYAFETEPVPPPMLLVTSSANPFSSYYAEILRAEGLNLFSTADVTDVTPSFLSYFNVVVLGEMSLTGAQVSMLEAWVEGGGNLIAMRPDKQLAGLLGLADASGTLGDAYLKVDTSAAPGQGIVGETMQYHGTADRYTPAGANVVATLYSNATAGTGNPAVTVRDVGTEGGQAAAFTYDLARSVVYTRQGNPAWAGQDRDGVAPIRPHDLFFGGASPDWVDLSKVAIPQADEQQRLFANLVIQVESDNEPLPRFWYLPRNEKAAVVLTGDDHAFGGTAARFDQHLAESPAGCSVADWECIRSTSYVYAHSPLTNAQAVAYEADGFEVALHVNTGCQNWTPESLDEAFELQLFNFANEFPGVDAPVSNRTHCIAWSDWASQAKIEEAYGIRFDTNYYYYPASWVAGRPGVFTGSAMPMRFADLDGSTIDVYQATTQMTDESGQSYPATVDTLLDRALGPEGYYGVYTANTHTDEPTSAASDAVVASAKARGVPVVTSRQMLEWVDGRNTSSFSRFAWSGDTMSFTITPGAGANGLTAMLPLHSARGTVNGITRDGGFVTFSTETVKGVEYAVFPAAAGRYAVAIDDTTVPRVTASSPTDGQTNVASASSVTAAFSTAMNGATLDSSSFTLRTAGGALVPATVSYNATTATAKLTPSSALAHSATYTASIDTTVSAADGTPLAAGVTWTFTTGVPTVTSRSPAAESSEVPLGSTVRATFSSHMDAATITSSSFTLTPAGSATPVAAAVSYDAATRTATLVPTAALTAGTRFTARLELTVAATDGTTLAAAATWSFTTTLCPCRLFQPFQQPSITKIPSANGRNPDEGPHAIELGVKVTVSAPVRMTALRFFKDSTETGTHLGRVWRSTGASTGAELAQVQFLSETSSGWQQQALASPLLLEPGNVYVVSVTMNTAFTQTINGLATQIVSGPLRTVVGNNGVYTNNAGTYPTESYSSSNYWIDLEVVAEGELVPPVVNATVPAAGATGVDRNAQVRATMSRPLNPATVNASTFTLHKLDGTAVPATVAYDSTTNTAVLTPSTPLAFLTGYRAELTTAISASDGTSLADAYSWNFTTADAPPPPGVSLKVPADGVNDVGSLVRPRAEFSKALDPATITNTTFTLAGPSGPVAATVAYDGTRRAATMTPSAPLVNGATYTARLDAGVTATDGATLGAPVTWSFTVAPTDPGAPALSGRSPAAGASGVAPSTPITATFSRSMDPATITSASMTLTPTGGTVPLSATVAYNATTKTATLTPAVPLSNGTGYRVDLGATILAADGVALAAPATWTFTTSTCPCTLFADTLQPGIVGISTRNGRPVEGGPYSLELGVKISVTESSLLTAVRYYRDSLETGTHQARIWTGAGTLVTTVPFASETGSGWQTQTLASPVPLSPGTVYVVSVGANSTFVQTLSGLAGEIVSGPLRSIVGSNGVFGNAAGAFPTQSFSSSNYFVDAAVAPAAGTALTVIGRSPAADAVDVSRSANVEARFSRSIDPATLTAATFTLRRPDGIAVSATLSYASATSTAVLDPSLPLAYNTTYTATAANGIRTSDGVALTPTSWSFRTEQAPPTVTATDPADGSFGVIASDNITATFSRDMDPATITSTSFTLTEAGGTLPVPSAITYDAATRTATLNPSAVLAAGATYVARLETTVADTAGVRLASPVTWTFDTNADTTPPDGPLISFGGFTNASSSGNTVYFRSGAAGGFALTATAVDPESAVEIHLPELGTGWSLTGNSYAFATGASDPGEPLDVVATNAAGLSSTTSFTVTPDSAAPETSILCDNVPCSDDWYTSPSVGVSLSAVDAAAGVAEVRYTLDGSDPSPLNGQVYLAPFPVSATTTVTFRAYDRVGNEEAVGSHEILVDSTAPSAPALTLTAGANTKVDDLTVYFRPGVAGDFSVAAVSEDAQSAVDTYEFDSLGNGWSNLAGEYTFDPTASEPAGPNEVTATNGAGLNAVSTFGVVADATAPTTSALCNGGVCSNWHTAVPVNVTLVASDGQSGLGPILYSLDGTAPSLEYDGAIPLSATTTIRFAASDLVGNVEATNTVEIRIDTIAPTATIDDQPDDPSKLTTATFDFSADETGVTFECKLDSGDWEACTSPRDYTALAEAGHTFSVRATDPAGNTGPADPFAWTVDATAPTATIDSAPADPSKLTSASFDFGSEANATFECKLDSGDWAPCTSPRDYTGLAEAGHTFSVRATDPAGNTGPHDTFAWTVDTTAPTATIDSAPADPTALTSATFDFSADETGVTFECKLDSGDWEACTSPRDYTALAEAGHTFSVRATDAAGNTGPADSFAWTVDTTAPTASIDSAPADPSKLTSATFDFSSEPNATFECKLDSGDWAPCTSPRDYTALADGPHTFSVRATDPAGNTGPDDSFAWTVDTTAPSATIDSSPSDPTALTSASFDFSSEPSATFECKLDSGDWAPCTSPRDYTALADGPHSFSVRAADAAGNTGPHDTFAWTVDTTAPAGSVTCDDVACGSGWFTTAVSVGLSASDSGSGIAAIRYTTDGTTPDENSALYGDEFTISATTTITFRAYDAVGNAEAPQAKTILVDTSAPAFDSVTYSGFLNASQSGGTVYFRSGTAGTFTVAASASDNQSGISSIAYPFLGSGWANTLGAYSFDAGAADPDDAAIIATNGAGASTDAALTVTADGTAPFTTATCDGVLCTDGWYTSTEVEIALAASDFGSGVREIRYTLDGSEPTPLHGSLYVAPFDVVGTAMLKFRAFDNVGNEELLGERLIRIDPTPPSTPELSFSDFENAAERDGVVYFREGSSGGFTVDASSTDLDSLIAGYGYPGLGDGWTGNGGEYAFTGGAGDPIEPNTVRATNGAGLFAETSFTVTSDTAAPQTTIACNSASCSSGWYTSAPVTVRLAATDAGSGVASIRYTTDGTEPTPASPAFGSDLILAETTRVRYRAYDRVGNVEADSDLTIRIDGTQPDALVLELTENAADMHVVGGTTLYYNPTTGHAGTFALTAESGEVESTLTSSSFPSLGGMTGGGEDSSAPFETSYAWNDQSTASGSHDVSVENEAGLATTGSFTVLPDATGPSGGSIAYADGYAAGAIAIATSDGTDGGSGVAGGTLLRQTAALAAGGCSAYGAWLPVTSPDTLADGVCARYRYDVLDNVGNSTTYDSSSVVKVDRTAPSAPELALSESDADTHENGTTLFFNPAGDGGTFDVEATTADEQSGIARVAFPAIAGAVGGGDDSDSPYSAVYTWTPAAAAGANDVTAHNGSGLPAASSFTLAADTTAPSGQTIALNGGAWATTPSIAFTTDAGFDGGSDLDAASARVERSEAALDHGVCGEFGPYSGSYSSPDTSVAGGSCYRYRFSIADNVGNRSAWVDTAVVKVDTTAPPAPELAIGGHTKSAATGTTIWFNDDEAGGFTITATVDDPESGIASTSFPALGGGWDNTGGAYTFTAAALDPAEPKAVTATNNAGLTSDGAAFTVTEDGSAPANGSVAYPDTWLTTANVAVTLADGTDEGSGVDTAGEQLRRASSTLADGVCGTLGAFAGIATNPTLAYNDGTVASGNCYAYAYEVSDRVGNTTTYTSTAVAKVDTDLPTVTQDDPGANLRAVVTLTAGAADTGGSGVAQVAFERSTGPDTWAPVGTDETAPYSAPLDTDTPATPDGLYAFRAIVTDRAGNVTTSAAVVNRRIDNTKPTAAIQNPGAYLSGLVTLTSTSSDDGGSGVASVEYARSSDGTTWTPTPASWATTASDDGVYTFRVTVTDVAGNSQTSSIAGRMVDNTKPAAATTPIAAKVRGTVALGSTSSDTGGSGVADVAFQYRLAGGAWSPTMALWDTTDGPDGSYDVRVVVTDRAGNVREADAVSTLVANDAPDVASRTPVDGASDVLPATVVTATFSGPMDESTIDAASFTLRGPGDALVEASVSYDAGTNTATLTPEALLEEQTTYTAHVAGTVQAASGEPIFAAEAWTFATGITPPAVSGRTPAADATGVAVDIAPTVTFSRAMNPTTITAASLRLTGPEGIVATTVTYDPATLAATITPSAALENETEYTIDVLTTVKSTEGVSLTSSVTWDFTTSPAAPTVTGRTPAPAATGIALDVRPTVTFSRPMDSTTITGSNIGLSGPAGAVAATVTYDSATMTATLTPAAALAPETAYTVTVATGVLSADSIALLNPVGWSFTTRPPAPTVTARTPSSGATNVARDVSPTVTFSRAMDASTINASNITLSGPAGAVPAAVTYDAATFTAAIDPAALLDAGSLYTVTVSTDVISAQGIALESQAVSSFTTVSPPTVTGRTPASGASGVATMAKPTATFSQAISAATVTTASFTLTGPGGAVAATVSYDAATLTATLSPNAALSPGTLYTATLTNAIATPAGATLAQTSWSFTTTSAPEVYALTPADGASDVAPSASPTGPKISAKFSRAMDAATLTASSFTLWTPANVQVPSTLAYDAATWTASITPNLPLDLSTEYTVKLETTIKDTAGVALASQVVSRFTTSGIAAPMRIQAGNTTTAYTAASGDVYSRDLYFKGGLVRSFATATVTNTPDQALYKDERYGLWTYSIPVSNGTYDVRFHLAEMTYTAINKRKFHIDIVDTALLNDVANIDVYALTGARYKAHVITLRVPITDGKLDLKAVGVTDSPIISAVEVVPAPPAVTGFTPGAGATGVSTAASPTATFDRAMDVGSVQGAFRLTGPGGAAVAANVTLDAARLVATVDPSAPLAPNTTYTATIAGTARDQAGMTVAAPVTWSFTTGP